MNTLYYGDNLDVLREHIADESVDLVYLDPPFKSMQDYNVLFEEKDGTDSAAQIKAFEDTWHWDMAAVESYTETVEAGGDVSRALQAFRGFLGTNDMMAYLAMMAPRLVELRRVLKPTGSIYLHCDPTASHYLKMLMDAVFGGENLQNEIIWYYRGGGVSKKRYGRRHDIILFYAKGTEWTFNVDEVRTEYSPETLERLKYKAKAFREGKVYDSYEQHPKGKHPDDVWVMQPIMPSSKERLSYPTQKPERLMEHVIKASSNEGATVLDPFCGCGTTIAVAERLNRPWIGIDITHLAINLIKWRLQNAFEGKAKYEVIGEPVVLAGAQQLAEDDRYQFQWWALGLVGARPYEKKKGADKGIDGRLYFHDDASGKTKQIVISVKSGHVQVSHIRDLRGVLDSGADIGVFITLNEPTKPMRTEAADAGFYTAPCISATKHPRIQILTVEELLSGKRIDYPVTGAGNVTFKKAPKANRGNPDSPKNDEFDWGEE